MIPQLFSSTFCFEMMLCKIKVASQQTALPDLPTTKTTKIFQKKNTFCLCLKSNLKIRRGPKLEGCAFANFGNSSGAEGKPSQKREKKGEKETNQYCRDLESNTGPVNN